jgi:heme/copper-type cytochrome/quinol oxidase subunit 3
MAAGPQRAQEPAPPFELQPHPVTGLTNGRLGLWLFLASDAMLFGALFSAYLLLRTAAPQWPPSGARASDLLSLPLGLLQPLLLAAAAMLHRAGHDRARVRTALALLLPLSSLALRMLEWRALLRSGGLPSTDNWYALFYCLTGLHALHVAAGLVVLLPALGMAASDPGPAPHQPGDRASNQRLYWGWLSLLAALLFAALYLP